MQDEHTEELQANMSNVVIIPTVGTGSRMGELTSNVNKALLPYKNKPILSHIIEQFPIDTKFLIPIGHLKEQVIDFCTLAYADRNIEYIEVDDYTSINSGTGYTLKQCKSYVNTPFWYIPCDTYFEEQLTIVPYDCYWVKNVDSDKSSLYTMFRISDYTIQDIQFKEHITDCSNYVAFTGVMYINDYVEFFNTLDNIDSNEFIPAIPKNASVNLLNTWKDFGDPVQYIHALNESQKFDFTKKDEITYQCNNKVIKWWNDSTIAEKKYRKSQTNIDVYPKNVRYKGNYMVYDFFNGTTLYVHNDSSVFENLLSWLNNDVWKRSNVDISESALEFYKTKTLSRIDKFLKKYTNLTTINYIDGLPVRDYIYYLNNIDWDDLVHNTIPCYTHGDLQFDNIIINENNEFKIIDWRHEFGSIVEYGDMYYDLAKMLGGFIINYANIKDNNFAISIESDHVYLSVPNIDDIDTYKKILKEFSINNNLDYKKISKMVSIIFWNMSPLHTEPFDLFLWYLGIKLFQELENDS